VPTCERPEALAQGLVGSGVSQLPPPDPAEGAAAEAQAAEARANALAELSAGSLTLAELLVQVEGEEPHHQLGHIHVRAALLALPHIGEVRADEVLASLGLEPGRHLASLGREQQVLLCENAAAVRGEQAEQITE